MMSMRDDKTVVPVTAAAVGVVPAARRCRASRVVLTVELALMRDRL